MTTRKRALAIVELLIAKKGGDVLLLDLRRATPAADFFVLASAQSVLHAQALANEIVRQMKQAGEPPHHVEGQVNGDWILVDFIDIVVHIFRPEVRQFYGLERLWGDMPKKRFGESSPEAKA